MNKNEPGRRILAFMVCDQCESGIVLQQVGKCFLIPAVSEALGVERRQERRFDKRGGNDGRHAGFCGRRASGGRKYRGFGGASLSGAPIASRPTHSASGCTIVV